MKINIPLVFKTFTLSLFFVLFFSCKGDQTLKDSLPDPQIQSGTAKVSGKVTGYHPDENKESPALFLYVSHPVTAETLKLETKLAKDGSFHFDVPLECNFNIAYLGSSLFKEVSILVSLVSGEETKMEIVYDGSQIKKVNMESSLPLASGDITHAGDVMTQMIKHHSPAAQRVYAKSPEEFAQNASNSLARKLDIADKDSILSASAKGLVKNEFRLVMLYGRFLDYSGMMHIDYLNTTPESEHDKFVAPPEPGRSYYSFLKDFNLNDPQYLYNDSYHRILQTILSNDTLNIPHIDDMPVGEWQEKVKTIMSAMIGSDTGMFYEMLTANSYARQFNDETRPLSDKQKENIKNHFKEGEIAKILLAKNEEIVKLDKEKGSLTINETPAVPKEKLLDAIAAKYKGKAIVIDLWATWCGPCMNAMKEIKMVKSAVKDKNVVFVYITNVSSPEKLWAEKIKGIGGEHYYLTEEEWVYIMDTLELQGIPSYLLYDTKGAMKNKVTGYPGFEKMQQMIEGLLQ